jgi:hypothetical protein
LKKKIHEKRVTIEEFWNYAEKRRYFPEIDVLVLNGNRNGEMKKTTIASKRTMDL